MQKMRYTRWLFHITNCCVRMYSNEELVTIENEKAYKKEPDLQF